MLNLGNKLLWQNYLRKSLIFKKFIKSCPSEPIVIRTDRSRVELETQYEYDLSSKLLKSVRLSLF